MRRYSIFVPLFHPMNESGFPRTTALSIICRKSLFWGRFRVGFEKFPITSFSGIKMILISPIYCLRRAINASNHSANTTFSMPRTLMKTLPIVFRKRLDGYSQAWKNLLYVITSVPFFRSSARRLILKPQESNDIPLAIRLLAFVNRITELFSPDRSLGKLVRGWHTIRSKLRCAVISIRSESHHFWNPRKRGCISWSQSSTSSRSCPLHRRRFLLITLAFKFRTNAHNLSYRQCYQSLFGPRSISRPLY